MASSIGRFNPRPRTRSDTPITIRGQEEFEFQSTLLHKERNDSRSRDLADGTVSIHVPHNGL
jgi:hypothetical protein